MSEEEKEEGDGGGWLVSYADLMTLLFAAFVVLYGITPRGQSNEILGIASSIREAFIEVPDEIEDETLRAEVYNGKLSFKEATRDSEINPAIRRFNRRSTLLRGQTENLNEVEILMQQALRGRGLHPSLRQATHFEKHELGLDLRLLGMIIFDQTGSRLSKKAEMLLENLVPALEAFSGDLVVEGHASAQSQDGGNALQLAVKRAMAVRDYLEQNSRIQGKIHLANYADLRPLDTAEGLVYDRIEIKLRFDELFD